MPDLCETYLTIEGLNYEVENVIEFLSNPAFNNNPYSSMLYNSISDETSLISNVKNMFIIHQGAPVFGTNKWGDKVSKACIYFTKTSGPPINDFLKLSEKFKNVGFLLDFESTWELYFGKIYFLNGECYYASYKTNFHDIEGFDIKLNLNGDWEYLTMDYSMGALVPIERLQPLSNSFIKANPEDIQILLKYLPSYMEKYDGLDPDEFLIDDYIPKFYINQK
jgi:hypothetical protein